jgi:hypothetical protein
MGRMPVLDLKPEAIGNIAHLLFIKIKYDEKVCFFIYCAFVGMRIAGIFPDDQHRDIEHDFTEQGG